MYADQTETPNYIFLSFSITALLFLSTIFVWLRTRDFKAGKLWR